MIYTVTLNPAIDYIMQLDRLEEGLTNRSRAEQFRIGGKGINVSIVLNNLDVKTTALGFIGGFSGAFIREQLQNYPNITDKFTSVSATTRINVKIKAETETEINGGGGTVDTSAYDAFHEQLRQLHSSDIVVLSGSTISGCPADWYVTTTAFLTANNISFTCDIATPTLLEVAQNKPLLVKPNEAELADIFGVATQSDAEVIELAQKLFHAGAQHVIVSQGGAGAILVCSAGVYKAQTPPGTLVDSVGAGDSMVAGFVATYSKSVDSLQAFRAAVSCGSATAYASTLATKEQIQSLMPQVNIEKIR